MRHRNLYLGPHPGHPGRREPGPEPRGRDRGTRCRPPVRGRGPLADPSGRPAVLHRGGRGDRGVERRRRLHPARVRSLRRVERGRPRRRDVDRRSVRGPPRRIPARAAQTDARDVAHRPARPLTGDPRNGRRDRGRRPRPRRDGRVGRRHPDVRDLRPVQQAGRDPPRNAPHRADGAPPAEGQARAGGAPDRLDLRSGRAGQGARVHDRGDAGDRGRAPRRPVPDRRADASGVAAPAGRGVPQQAAGACRVLRDGQPRRVRQLLPRAEGHHRVPACERRLRNPVPGSEPDHERHALVRARGREGRRVDALSPRGRGAGGQAGTAGRIPIRRSARRGRELDPGGSQAQARVRAARLCVREPGHMAEDRREVRAHDGRARSRRRSRRRRRVLRSASNRWSPWNGSRRTH